MSMATLESIKALLEGVSGEPNRMARLARVLLAKGLAKEDRTLCAQAVEMVPDDAEVYVISAEVFRHGVPNWFFPMVQDHHRHSAYENAMSRVIKPGYQVLEIGTGTGLFSMMAARAGATKIVTCESNSAVAFAVSEIIAQNGYSDRAHDRLSMRIWAEAP